MQTRTHSLRRGAIRWLILAALAVVGVVVAATYSNWGPRAGELFDALVHRSSSSAETAHGGHDAAGDHHDGIKAHGHDESAHANPNHLELSPQAQRNIGLTVGAVKLQPYERAITIPGMIVERPGRTSAAVAAPLGGVVMKIAVAEGEAVAPEQELFRVRLTHEEIVQAQGEFLKTVAELDVNQREIKRLAAIAAEGAIPGRAVLERKYEQEKLEAVLQAQREALLLHGLSAEQVAAIERDRKLLQGLTVYAPGSDSAAADGESPIWQVQELKVSPGQHVDAGDTLAILADYRTLFIQGTAFEQDTREIQSAATEGRAVSALISIGDDRQERLDDLNLVYTSGRVDPNSRTFHFFVALPNQLLRDATHSDGHRFVDWRFKPGQRVQLRVPVETWNDCLVLPVGAVAREGAESYVFQVNGESFERRPVHEKYRDQESVVIANDGSIFPGDHLALSGAQQLQIALKNKSGGAIDPHAGHSH